MLEEYIKKTEPEYYPPVENLLDLIYEHYTENNPVEKNTVAGKAAKAKEKELEEWLRGLEGMDRLVDDYVGDKIPLWEKIMDRQGTVCCAWEKTAFEEGMKVRIRLMRILKVLQKLVVFQGTVCAGAVGWQRSLHLKPVGVKFIEADWLQHIII